MRLDTNEVDVGVYDVALILTEPVYVFPHVGEIRPFLERIGCRNSNMNFSSVCIHGQHELLQFGRLRCDRVGKVQHLLKAANIVPKISLVVAAQCIAFSTN